MSRRKHKHKSKPKQSHKKKGKPALSQAKISGKLTVTPAGFGFIKPDEGDRDVFIPPRFMGGALDGDIVEASLLDSDPYDLYSGKGPAGKIINIIKRSRTKIVGELLAGRRVRPLNKNLPDDINVGGSLRGANKGEWVQIELTEKIKDGLRGNINKVIGQVGTIDADLDAVVCEYELPEPYTPAQDEEAALLEPRKIDRKDLTSLFCVTIDPHDAKDFDDAISIAAGKNKDELQVGVHIADVAAWIKSGGKWDKEARERSFTSYLPGRTLPMLPKTLTKNISLTADGESLAHTVLLTVNSETGEILESKRCHSRIQVNKRMTFDEVQEFIDGSVPKDWDDKIIKNMKIIVDITKKMRAFRKKAEKFLELATAEIRVICDFEKKQIIGLERRTQKQADQLVEDCMLAANTEVAKELISRSIPGMFRIHPEPDPEKLEDFYTFVSKTFGFFPGDLSSRSACNHFLANLPDDHKKPIIIGAFLRSLPRASYSEENEFHFGLGKGRYCHFTSPIRRYPDLVVHQQLWTLEAGGRLRSKKTVAKYAEGCSAKEMKNDEAYFSANDRLKLKYLEQEHEKAPSNMYEAVITKITSAGLLVDIVDLGIFGFVPVEYLGGRFKYKKKESTLKESRGGHQSFKCGDFIFLRLDRIDFIRATAIFRPVR